MKRFYSRSFSHRRTTSTRMVVGFSAVVFSFLISNSTFALDEVLVAPKLESSTYPDQHLWYSGKTATFSWDITDKTTAVRTLYDEKPTSLPTKLYEPAINSRTFTVDTDGVHYMHVQLRQGEEWGPVAHRVFKIDTQPPRINSVIVSEEESNTYAAPTLLIRAEDALSGLDLVTITGDRGMSVTYPMTGSDRYKVRSLKPGKHDLVVTVVDKAGNKAEKTVSLTVSKLDTPTLIGYTRRASAGNKVAISGLTYPNKKVEFVFTNESGGSTVYTVRSDDEGLFTYTLTGELESGVYDMVFRVVDESGAVSSYTEPRTIIVDTVKFMKVSMFIMNWLSVILVSILSGTLVLITVWYSCVHFSRFRRKVRRTIKEAENTVKTNVMALRRDTEEFHTLLVKAEKKRELTKEEQTILKKFKKRLDIVEKEIEKKLEKLS